MEPSGTFEKAFLEFSNEYAKFGEAERASKYLFQKSDFPSYVDSLRSLASQGRSLTFWLFTGGFIAGVVRIRPKLNEDEAINDGHIGFDVAPSKRRQGHGTTLLQLALIKCRELCLDHLILTCLQQNIASKATIERFGPTYLGTVRDLETGLPLLRYRIQL